MCRNLKSLDGLLNVVFCVFAHATFVPGYAADLSPLIPGVFNPANSHTYYLLPASSWTEAEKAAVQLGGHLVTINDQAENDWVFNTFNPIAPLKQGLWIGISDVDREGVWVWSSAESVTYQNWAPGEPNNSWDVEDYGHICTIFYGTHVPGKWNDVQDNEPNRLGVVEVNTVKEPCELFGYVTDALTKSPLNRVEVATQGQTCFTDTNGFYLIGSLIPGALRADFDASERSGGVPLRVKFFDLSSDASTEVLASKNGYTPYTNKRVQLLLGESMRLDFSLSPPPSGLRFVLNWGSEPLDLDAYLLTPFGDQVWYAYRGQSNDVPYALLDVDERNGYGPETTSINKWFSGSYHYYVHNFVEIQRSGELTNSAAVVQIYNDKELVRSIYVPAHGRGDYWDVCTIDGTTQEITLINQIKELEPLALAEQGHWVKPIQAPSSAPLETLTYYWEFGDGTWSNEAEPEKVYVVPGRYTVGLRVRAEDGREAIEKKLEFITAKPILKLMRSEPNVVVQWECLNAGWQLEATMRLGDHVWTPVMESVAFIGLTNTVITPCTGIRFFRLRMNDPEGNGVVGEALHAKPDPRGSN